MSWLMRSVVMRLRFELGQQSTMRDWMVTSRPVVGSSAIRSEGLGGERHPRSWRADTCPGHAEGKLSKRSPGESMRSARASESRVPWLRFRP